MNMLYLKGDTLLPSGEGKRDKNLPFYSLAKIEFKKKPHAFNIYLKKNPSMERIESPRVLPFRATSFTAKSALSQSKEMKNTVALP